MKVLLQKIAAKVDANLPLTVDEEELLAEMHRQVHLKPRETMSVNSDGAVQIKKTVDAEPIMTAMLEYKDVINQTYNKSIGKVVGSIDPMTAENWAKETGLKIGSKEFAQFGAKRIKNDIDYRKFRFGH